MPVGDSDIPHLRPGLSQRVKQLGRRAAGQVGGSLSRLLGPRAAGCLGIFTYHRLAPWHGSGSAPTWNVTPRRFHSQMEGLLARGYRALPLRQALGLGRQGAPFPPRSFVITFDDGQESVYRHAWPILREMNLPATVFLATAYLDAAGPFPFDDWALAGSSAVPAETWRPVTTAQCRELAEGGLVELGSHTHSHGVFRGRADPLHRDLVVSAAVLRDRFGILEPAFAFPYGIAGLDLAAAARRAGMACSLTTQEELVRPGHDPFAWGRFTVSEADSAATLAARLDGWFGLARGAWQRLTRRRHA
jgi:peptidoglycan/xylan/chitin deacetylase (PgdA/CDA1 family)